MAEQDIPNGAKLKPYTMNDALLLQIGKLARGFAELEYALIIFISGLANHKSEMTTRLFLGKTGYGTRKNLASDLVAHSPNEIVEAILSVFENEWVLKAQDFRNALAHGVLLGESDDGRLAFFTDRRTGDPLETAKIMMIPPSHITHAIIMTEWAVSSLDKMMKLQPLREKLQHIPPVQRPKSQHPRNRPEISEPPPPPSEASQ